MKCRIIASGKPAVNDDGQLAYSVLQQGTGLVDAKAAVYGTLNNCANQGLNIAADLAGTQHFMGASPKQADGTFPVTSPNGMLWDQGYTVGPAASLGQRLPVGHGLSSGRQSYVVVNRASSGARRRNTPGHSVGGWLSRASSAPPSQHGVADVRQRLGRAGIVRRQNSPTQTRTKAPSAHRHRRVRSCAYVIDSRAKLSVTADRLYKLSESRTLTSTCARATAPGRT